MYRLTIDGIKVVICDRDLDWALASLHAARQIPTEVEAEHFKFGYLPGSVVPQVGEVAFSPYRGAFYAGTEMGPGGRSRSTTPGYYIKWFGTDWSFAAEENFKPEMMNAKVNLHYPYENLKLEAASTVASALAEARSYRRVG